MKYLIFTTLLMLLLNCDLLSQLSIHEIVHKDYSNPQTGKIVLKENAPGCKPYHIFLTGETTQYSESRLNQNPLPNGLITFQGLEPDRYEIKIEDNSGCPHSKFVMIKGCSTSFQIDMQLPPATCSDQDYKLVEAITPPLTAPVKYEWFRSNGQYLGGHYDNPTKSLKAGDYIVKVTDANGCMEMKKFKIEKFIWKLIIPKRESVCSEYDLVTAIVQNQHNAPFNGKSFHYQWSDGSTNHTSSVETKLVRFDQSISVTVTDPITGCQLIGNSPPSARIPSPEYEINRITRLKHDIDANNKGEADIIIGSRYYPSYTIKIYLNNNLISTLNNVKNRVVNLKDLAPGPYRIEIYEGGSNLCMTNPLEFTIRTCDGPKNQVSIEVESKRLPITAQNFFVQFKVNNAGGPCLYKYYMDNGGTNSVFINKENSSIEYPDAQKILTATFRRNLIVEAFCPCGSAKFSMDAYPCNLNFKLKTREETIVYPCFGTLDGEPLVLREKGSIRLKISLPENFKTGSDGVAEYGNYLKNFSWNDGVAGTYHMEANNILVIEREVSEVKNYLLEFNDGIGCYYWHLIDIKQDFKTEKKGECTFTAWCDKKPSPQDPYKLKKASLSILDGENCVAIISCDNSSGNKTIQGTKYLGEQTSSSGGICRYFRYCRFDIQDEIDPADITLPQNVTKVSNIHLTNGHTLSGGFFTKTIVDGDCCETFFNEQNLAAFVTHLSDSRFGSPVVLEEEKGDHFCFAKLVCQDGWKLLTGIASLTNKYCYLNGECVEEINCDYYSVGKNSDGQVLNLVNYEKLKTFNPTNDPTKCDERTETCSRPITLSGDQNGLKNNKSITFQINVFPNPADERIHIKLVMNEILGKVHFSLMNLMGKCVISADRNFTDQSLITEELDTRHISPGVYLLKVDRQDYSKTYKIIIHR